MGGEINAEEAMHAARGLVFLQQRRRGERSNVRSRARARRPPAERRPPDRAAKTPRIRKNAARLQFFFYKVDAPIRESAESIPYSHRGFLFHVIPPRE